jgi:DNA-binding transcriptional LysR family regulator
MTNIPTDLLRTLVAVVDLRSFTKAAQSLGVTQPAVSAQIRRLQFLLGADLLTAPCRASA